jgi:hypothetical protein
VPDGTNRREVDARGPVLSHRDAVLVGPSVTRDAGRVLADPATTVVERPGFSELPDLLRDRAGRVRVPPVVTGVPPGTLASPISVNATELTGLLRGTATDRKVVWSRAGSEVLVHVDGIEATLRDGAVAVTVPVETVQTGRVGLPVVFAMGTEDRDAGLLAATVARPPGPAAVVEPWGEAVQALAWQALLQVAVALAARAGTDRRGDPLAPAALRATAQAFVVVPQARHRQAR